MPQKAKIHLVLDDNALGRPESWLRKAREGNFDGVSSDPRLLF
jgi:hypothetical protein